MAISYDSNRDARRGLFDVLARHSGRILLAFYVIWILLAVLLTGARISTAENPPLNWPEIAIIGIVSAAITVGIAFPLAFAIMEGIPMVLAEIRKRLWREEGREKGLEEGREEGRKEAVRERDRLWEAWLQRREAAERDGQPFTEPPPSRNGTHNESRKG